MKSCKLLNANYFGVYYNRIVLFQISVTIKGSYSDRFEYEVKQGDIGQIVTKEELDREDTSTYTLIIRYTY